MRYQRDYDRGPWRSRPARYDREIRGRGGYDARAGYDRGWGMTGLYRHMMRGRIESQPTWARPISGPEPRGGERWQSWSGSRGYDRDLGARSGIGVGRWGYDRF